MRTLQELNELAAKVEFTAAQVAAKVEYVRTSDYDLIDCPIALANTKRIDLKCAMAQLRKDWVQNEMTQEEEIHILAENIKKNDQCEGYGDEIGNYISRAKKELEIK